MKNRDELADEDGNTLPPIDPKSDVGQLIYLLEYARARGFRIGPTVQIGDVVVQIHDIRQIEGRATSKQEAEPDIWAAHGHEG